MLIDNHAFQLVNILKLRDNQRYLSNLYTRRNDDFSCLLTCLRIATNALSNGSNSQVSSVYHGKEHCSISDLPYL